MISSRWPRPTFVIESIALMPVCSGSFTGWRAITPGALNSSGRVSVVSIGPWPSSGLPSGSTMRPISASPTGTLATRPVRRTGSPSLTCSHSPKSAAPTLSSSRLNARPVTPCSSSSISSATRSRGRRRGRCRRRPGARCRPRRARSRRRTARSAAQDRGDLVWAQLHGSVSFFSRVAGGRVPGEGVRGGRGRSRRRASSRPGGRGRRSGRGRRLRVASTWRPEACSICSTIDAALVGSESSKAVVSSTLRTALLAAPRGCSNSRCDLGDLARRGPSRRRAAGSCGRARRRPPSRSLEHAAPSRAGRAAGSAAAASSSGTVSSRRDEVARAPRGPAASAALLLGGVEERPARRCGARRPSSVRSASSTEKSRSPIASSIRRRWSSSVSDLAGHLARWRSSVSSATSARICSSARRVSASIWRLRLLEAPLAVGLGLLAHALALRVGDAARLGEDLLRLAAGLADQAAVLLEQLACLVAGVVGLVDRLRGSARAARRSPSAPARTRTA